MLSLVNESLYRVQYGYDEILDYERRYTCFTTYEEPWYTTDWTRECMPSNPRKQGKEDAQIFPQFEIHQTLVPGFSPRLSFLW